MKKIYFSLSLLFAAMTAVAQPVPLSVEPGSKGQLPVVPTLLALTEGHFEGLELDYAALNSWGNGWSAHLKFHEPERFGGLYYTLQERRGAGEWTDYKETVNGKLITKEFGKGTLGAEIPITYDTTYRLVMHGGDMDDYVSNEVFVNCPTMSTRKPGWNEDGINYVLVGKEAGTTYGIYVEGRDDEGKTVNFDQTSGYLTHQWYRRNPNTYEMTAIEGATGWTYTPTLADAGYNLIQVIQGDGVHCSFTQWHHASEWDHSICHVGVRSGVEYYGDEGFILNTDYVIPDIADMLGTKNGSMYADVEPLPEGEIKERKPGQYAFYMAKEDYEWIQLDFKNDEYVLNFCYLHGENDTPENPWYREAQLMPGRYETPLTVTVTSGGSPVAATVEVLGPDIDGKQVVKASADTDAEMGTATFEEGLYSLGDGYYVRAHAKGASQVTYYPGVTTQAAAKLVIPEYDENWNPTAISIELQGGEGKTGDVNGDNTVDVADIAAVIDVMAKATTPDASASGPADVNGDGTVDVADIAAIIDIMAGK